MSNEILVKAVENRLKRENINYQFDKDKGSILFFHKNKKFKIFVNNFPFRPPTKFSVDDVEVSYSNMASEIQFYLKSFFNIRCLCCISILCPNNWYISNSFTDILNEYENFIGLINTIKNYKLLKESYFFTRFPYEIEEHIISYIKNKPSD